MSQNHKGTVAIVGSGIIGLCSALRLQQQGYQVTLFDSKGVGNGASFGNAGHFATEQVFPLANPTLLPQLPKMLFDPLGPFKIQPNYLLRAIPWFVRFLRAMTPHQRAKNTKAIKALNEVSITKWQQLLAQIDGQDCLTLKGSLLTYEAASIEQLEHDFQQYRSQGVAVKKLTKLQLLQLEPDLSPNVLGALHFTDVGHTLDPLILSQRIFEAFSALGGELIESDVKQIASAFAPLMVETSDESYTFNKLIVCAGAFSKALALQVGYRVPLEVERGYHLMLPSSPQLTRPIASNDRKFIMTPMANGLRLAGTVEFGGLDNAPDYRRSEMMLTHAKALLPELKDLTLDQVADDARWMGFRPSLPDSLPVIDQSCYNPNIYFNFGHQHLGLTWGAVCGELIADLVAGKPSQIDLMPYRVNRF
ncbi:MAG: FAD-binding oxidoreductase [Gammaproteobacteria bacterium]|nr:FAD-binding oxidoreductase [Gammaproteobacteria bacterium]